MTKRAQVYDSLAETADFQEKVMSARVDVLTSLAAPNLHPRAPAEPVPLTTGG